LALPIPAGPTVSEIVTEEAGPNARTSPDSNRVSERVHFLTFESTRCDLGGRLEMDEAIKTKILTLLDQHRNMTIATLRADGWPQATTVGYANDAFTLYFLCGLDSQKAANLARDNRVSLTIDDDTPEVMEITGLSMAARAEPVVDRAEAEKALRLLMLKYPEQKSLPSSLPMPTPENVRIFRLTPTVISVLDYSKGFGHTDLVTC